MKLKIHEWGFEVTISQSPMTLFVVSFEDISFIKIEETPKEPDITVTAYFHNYSVVAAELFAVEGTQLLNAFRKFKKEAYECNYSYQILSTTEETKR